MAAITICSDFGAQENKVSHCFHWFPIYLPWSDGAGCHDLKFFECWVLSQLFGRVMSLLLNMLSRLVITSLPRSKRLLISWLQSPSAVILEPPKIKSDTVSTVSLSIFHEVMGPDAMILVFWMLSFKPTFSLSCFTFIKRLFSSSSLSAIRVSSAYLRLLIFLPAILTLAWA